VRLRRIWRFPLSFIGCLLLWMVLAFVLIGSFQFLDIVSQPSEEYPWSVPLFMILATAVAVLAILIAILVGRRHRQMSRKLTRSVAESLTKIVRHGETDQDVVQERSKDG
jgi:uncharacterized membrane protein